MKKKTKQDTPNPGGKKKGRQKKPLPACPMNRPDCFALNDKKQCTALENVRFRCGECPFYRTAEANRRSQAAGLKRLMDLGRADLMSQYGITVHA